MSEQFIKLIEIMLCRIFYAGLSSLDAQYTQRKYVGADEVAYRREVDNLIAWYTSRLAVLRKVRVKYTTQPKTAVIPRTRNVIYSPEDLLNELIATCIASSWLKSSTVLSDIRLLQKQVNFIVEIASANPLRCLTEMRILAQSLAPLSETTFSSGGAGSKVQPSMTEQRCGELVARILKSHPEPIHEPPNAGTKKRSMSRP